MLGKFDCVYLLKGAYNKQVKLIIKKSLEMMLVTITSPKIFKLDNIRWSHKL